MTKAMSRVWMGETILEILQAHGGTLLSREIMEELNRRRDPDVYKKTDSSVTCRVLQTMEDHAFLVENLGSIRKRRWQFVTDERRAARKAEFALQKRLELLSVKMEVVLSKALATPEGAIVAIPFQGKLLLELPEGAAEAFLEALT